MLCQHRGARGRGGDRQQIVPVPDGSPPPPPQPLHPSTPTSVAAGSPVSPSTGHPRRWHPGKVPGHVLREGPTVPWAHRPGWGTGHGGPLHGGGVALGLSIPGAGGQQGHPKTHGCMGGSRGLRGGAQPPLPLLSRGPLRPPPQFAAQLHFKAPHPCPAGTPCPAEAKVEALPLFSGTGGGCRGGIWGGFGDIFKTNTFTKEDLKV